MFVSHVLCVVCSMYLVCVCVSGACMSHVYCIWHVMCVWHVMHMFGVWGSTWCVLYAVCEMCVALFHV